MKKILLVVMALLFALSTYVGAAPATAFVDVPASDPSYGYIQQLIKANVIQDTNGAFNGNKTVTKYEMATYVAKAMKSVDTANAANKVIIQKLYIEFQAELETMDVRVSALETKATAINSWFTPTMPKWSGEFAVAYNDGAKNYFAPYVNGTGTLVSNQANNFEIDLNYNGNLATQYNMQYHGGFAFSYNYIQTYNQVDGALSSLGMSQNWDNSNIYIDGNFPGLTNLTKAAYGADTTFAVGRIGYCTGITVDSNINGARLSNVFANGLTINAYYGVDNSTLAYAGSYDQKGTVIGIDTGPGSEPYVGVTRETGNLYYGAIVKPGNNKAINGENYYNMYGQGYNSTTGVWEGNTGYSSQAVAVGVSYPINSFTLNAGYTDVFIGAGPGKPQANTAINPFTGKQNDTTAMPDGAAYDMITGATNITNFQSVDLGVNYDDGYYHGNVKVGYSPTYSGVDSEVSKYTSPGLICVNAGISAEVHAGTTDQTKQWSYDGYLKYSNLGPLMVFAPSGDTIGMGGIAYKIGANFTPLNGSLWENSITYITAAVNTAAGTDTGPVPYQNSTIFATKLHFYF